MTSQTDIDAMTETPERQEAEQWRPFHEAPADGSPILIDEGGYSVSIKWQAYDEDAAAELDADGYWTYSDQFLADACPDGPEVPFSWLPDPAALAQMESNDD